jgi:hypothetical protein
MLFYHFFSRPEHIFGLIFDGNTIKKTYSIWPANVSATFFWPTMYSDLCIPALESPYRANLIKFVIGSWPLKSDLFYPDSQFVTWRQKIIFPLQMLEIKLNSLIEMNSLIFSLFRKSFQFFDLNLSVDLGLKILNLLRSS